MNKQAAEQDWNTDNNPSFQSVRLRPGLDLLGQVGPLPEGDIIDLGCGTGSFGTTLKRRFPDRKIMGIDGSTEMLRKARYTGAYDALKKMDAAAWEPTRLPALIFSNAHCHLLSDHETLFGRLASFLAPGGVLAVQMPRQSGTSSHAILRVTAEALFPEKFDFSCWSEPVAAPKEIHQMLAHLGKLSVWETEYLQHLPAGKMGHPVLEYTEPTAMRSFSEKLTDSEQVQFLVTYGESLKDAYPLEPDGSVMMPMRRLFFVLTRS